MDKLLDPKYFIETMMMIVNRKQESVPFIFNYPQQKYYERRTKNDLILKPRKIGFSSEVEAVNLHACIFFENERAVTMAQNEDEMNVHRSRIDGYLHSLEADCIKFNVTLDKENQREIEFPLTRSRYWSGTAGSKTFGRSRDITRFHATEVAHYEDQGVLTGALNACVDGAWKVLETTANGMELFYDLWVDAMDPIKKSPWTCHFFSWFDDPSNVVTVPSDYNIPMRWLKMAKNYKLSKEQIAWYDKKYSEQTDKSLMTQEFPSNWQEAFISSGRHAFNVEMLTAMKKRCTYPLWVGRIEDDGKFMEWKNDPEGYWSVWKQPREGRKYIIPADIGEGIPHGTPSIATVIDRASFEITAEWRGRIDPALFGDVLVDAGRYFHNALLIPENNNFGRVTIQKIKDLKYKHLFRTDVIWPDKRVEDGFPTDDKTKGFLISTLRNAIEDQTYYENSSGAIDELIDAVVDEYGKIVSKRNRNKKGIDIVHHLDRMITRGIGLYCLKFLFLDETYRDSGDERSIVVVRQRTGDLSGKGYRRKYVSRD